MPFLKYHLQLVQCFLLKKRLTNIRDANFIAGALSGASYYTATEYNLFNVAVTSMVQLLLLDFQSKTNFQGLLKQIQNWSKKFPLRMVVFAITFPIACHSRIFYPYTLNRLALKCIDFTSGES